MKGDPRKRSAEGRRLRALAARIPDSAAFYDFLATVPEALRDQVKAKLVDHLNFRLRKNHDAS